MKLDQEIEHYHQPIDIYTIYSVIGLIPVAMYTPMAPSSVYYTYV